MVQVYNARCLTTTKSYEMLITGWDTVYQTLRRDISILITEENGLGIKED
jgi:hypothetical protein